MGIPVTVVGDIKGRIRSARLLCVNLTLNDTQLTVLRWIADGPVVDDPPTPTFKTIAIALRSRGLIELDRRRGQWNAAISDKGRFYLENGHHPDAVRKSSRTAARATVPRAAQVTEHATTAKAPATEPDTTKKDTQVLREAAVPIPSQIRKPHAAIRELLDYKSRVDVPAEQRHRSLLILHALVQEALRRGWTVTPVLSTVRRDEWTGSRTRTWPSSDLFSIDAGSAPAGVRLRMKQRQVDHVPTKEETAHEERYGWRNYRTHDYAPTDKMRLEIGAGSYVSLVLEDTVATRIEDKLTRAIDRIQSMTNEAIAHKQAQRLRAIEEAERQRQAEALRVRAVRYGKWVSTLDELHTAFTKRRQLTELVESLRAVVPKVEGDEDREQFARYVEWAGRHLRASDPLRTIPLPEGDAPELSFAEWERWHRANQHLFAPRGYL